VLINVRVPEDQQQGQTDEQTHMIVEEGLEEAMNSWDFFFLLFVFRE
jgi:hypothetical protein